MNNIFSGPGTMVTGSGAGTFWKLTRNLKAEENPGFRSLATYDYSLTSSATGAIDKGTTPGAANGVSLIPDYQYVHPLKAISRSIIGSAVDIGAYEFGNEFSRTPLPPSNLDRQ